MKIVDPGHIYELWEIEKTNFQTVTFVKRSGGAVTYDVEWPGVQTQAVMRAIIDYLDLLREGCEVVKSYALWQLGSKDTQSLTISSIDQVNILIEALIDRSFYLDAIIECVETKDAITWLGISKACGVHYKRMKDGLGNHPSAGLNELTEMIRCVRMALWCYEARAYRRKKQTLNRKHPAHDDTARLRSWRNPVCYDVPFTEHEIELMPIGEDGHVVMS